MLDVKAYHKHTRQAFQGMLIVGLILWNYAVEDSFHINPHVRITVFVDAQAATRMLREDVDDTCLGQFRQLAKYLTRHQMKAS